MVSLKYLTVLCVVFLFCAKKTMADGEDRIPYIRSPLARNLYSKMLMDERLRNMDLKELYTVRLLHQLPTSVRSRFVQLGPDEDTETFLATCWELNDRLLLQVFQEIARTFLGFFLQQTSINGILNRGRMFVWSRQQAGQLLTDRQLRENAERERDDHQGQETFHDAAETPDALYSYQETSNCGPTAGFPLFQDASDETREPGDGEISPRMTPASSSPSCPRPSSRTSVHLQHGFHSDPITSDPAVTVRPFQKEHRPNPPPTSALQTMASAVETTSVVQPVTLWMETASPVQSLASMEEMTLAVHTMTLGSLKEGTSTTSSCLGVNPPDGIGFPDDRSSSSLDQAFDVRLTDPSAPSSLPLIATRSPGNCQVSSSGSLSNPESKDLGEEGRLPLSTQAESTCAGIVLDDHLDLDVKSASLEASTREEMNEAELKETKLEVSPGTVPWQGHHVLDVGAGDGHVTRILAEGAATVTATEISAVMRGRLGQKGYRVLDAHYWPENDDATYDIVTCLNVLDRHVAPRQLVHAMRQKLRDDGRLVIALVLPFKPYVEYESSTHQPSEALGLSGASFEEQVTSLVDNILPSMGFQVQSWTKLPYYCEGDLEQTFYWLEDVVVVAKKTSVAIL